MSQDNIRKALYGHINTSFSAANIVFKGDSQRAQYFDNNTLPWIYVYISWGDEKQRSMGSPAQFVQRGILAAKLYVRHEDGEGLLDTISDSYKDISRCKQIDNISIWPMKTGPDEETDKWQVRHLFAPFEATYTKDILPV
jgi:hypothetical protein